MRYLSESIDDLNLVDGVNARRQSSMNTEDLIVNDNAEGEEVEHVGEVMPYVCVAIFPRAFGVEAVRLCDAARFVIASY